MIGMFNADEIYEMGIEIEKNGKIFYETAADQCSDKDLKNLLNDLSKWEDQHIKIFTDLRSQLPENKEEEAFFDADDQKHKYLKATADSHIFLQNNDPVEIVKNCDDIVQILKKALEFEKDSVVLYTSMLHTVNESLGKKHIQPLVEEELAHVAILQEKINELR